MVIMMITKDLLIYAITDRSWLKGQSLATVVDDVLKNGATFLQLREKNFSHDEMVAQAREIKKIANKYHVPFIINDDIYAAKEIDADGVHIGPNDIEFREARKILGPDKIIGVSARSVEAALTAERAGADYIGAGAVFHTSTKDDATSLSFEELKKITRAVSIPVAAIGGISYENMDMLKGTGINGIAVISAIFGQTNPGEATRELASKAKKLFL